MTKYDIEAPSMNEQESKDIIDSNNVVEDIYIVQLEDLLKWSKGTWFAEKYLVYVHLLKN